MFDTAAFEPNPKSHFVVSERSAAAPIRSKSKRTMDVVVAAALLLILAPLLVVVACYIRAESRGPALFRQRRGGLFGRPFSIYKFRTMRVMEDGEEVVQACAGDARVTAF